MMQNMQKLVSIGGKTNVARAELIVECKGRKFILLPSLLKAGIADIGSTIEIDSNQCGSIILPDNYFQKNSRNISEHLDWVLIHESVSIEDIITNRSASLHSIGFRDSSECVGRCVNVTDIYGKIQILQVNCLSRNVYVDDSFSGNGYKSIDLIEMLPAGQARFDPKALVGGTVIGDSKTGIVGIVAYRTGTAVYVLAVKKVMEYFGSTFVNHNSEYDTLGIQKIPADSMIPSVLLSGLPAPHQAHMPNNIDALIKETTNV